MLLVQPAPGTLEHRNQPWNDFLNFMETDDQQDSLTPAETVAHPPAGGHGGLSLAGLDLFADLDLDTLLGSTATSSAEPPPAIVAQPPSIVAPFGLHHNSIVSGVPAAWNAPMTHHATTYPAQLQPATLCTPVPFHIVISQNPAISVAMPGEAPNLAPIASHPWPLTGGMPGNAQLPGHGSFTPLPMKVNKQPAESQKTCRPIRKQCVARAMDNNLAICCKTRHAHHVSVLSICQLACMLAGSPLNWQL